MDLDDTLLNNERKISEYSLEVLNRLKEEHSVVINTARSLDATKDIINILKPDYTILNGGALIVKNLEVIYEKTISADVTNEILSYMKDVEEFSIECCKGLFCNLEEYATKNKRARYFDYANKFEYDAYKILLKSEDGILPNFLANKYNLEITHYVNGPWYRLSLCTKHTGNMALYEYLNDKSPKSICFGDDLGDIEMLENAYVGVAMCNSIETVLNKIKIVTKKSNNNDGVALFLDNYFKNMSKNVGGI